MGSFLTERWLASLEEATELRLTLRRGRVIARKGWVTELAVRPGLVTADVRDDNGGVNTVKIRMDMIEPDVWDVVLERAADEAALAGDLLRGAVSEGLAQAFEEAGHDLFPFDLRDISNFCSCRQDGLVCTDAVATHFKFVELITADPSKLLLFRGRAQGELVEALRERRNASAGAARPQAAAEPTRTEHASALADGFWARGTLPHLAFQIAHADVEGDETFPVLRALGPGPADTAPDAVAAVLGPLLRTGARRVEGIVERAGATAATDDAPPDSNLARDMDEVLVAAAHQHGYLTSTFVADALNVSARDARQYLQWLVEEGRLETTGRTRGTRYVIPGTVIDDEPEDNGATGTPGAA